MLKIYHSLWGGGLYHRGIKSEAHTPKVTYNVTDE